MPPLNNTRCPLCGAAMHEVVLNTIGYRRCEQCRFLSAQAPATGIDHYAHKESGLTPEKVGARERNSFDRMRVASAADFNNLCDIGAGEGSMLAAVYKRGYRNLVGIEPAAYLEELPKDDRFVLVRGTTADLSEVVKKYGLKNASMFHVIEHLPDAPAVLRDIFEALPPGGYLTVETPNSDSYAMRVAEYKHDLIYAEHVSLFNQANLKHALLSAGFSIVSQGRRDFDPPLSISESLVRLGLRPYRPAKNRMIAANSQSTPPVVSATQGSFAKMLLRRLLYIVVQVLRREDYIWVVAKK